MPEDEILQVRNITRSGYLTEECRPPQLGTPVKVARAPLCGLNGTLSSFRNGERVLISVTSIQKCLAVELPRELLVQGDP